MVCNKNYFSKTSLYVHCNTIGNLSYNYVLIHYHNHQNPHDNKHAIFNQAIKFIISKLSFVHTLVYVCVSLPLEQLMTSNVIWCHIDHVWLVKQVLLLFLLFSCFIWHLPLIKWMSVALVTQHVASECLPKKTKVTRY